MNFSPKKILFFFLLAVFYVLPLQATHYRAGEITYRLVSFGSALRYEATITVYTKYDGPSVNADRDSVTIAWGDGDSETVVRSNGFDADGNGFKDGIIIATSPINILKSEYTAQHTYAGVPPASNRFYVISFYDQNRIDGIANIQGGNSVDIPFYVEDSLKFPTDLANIGSNSSPILRYPPIDYANLNDTFYHNPLAIDADRDSLDFQLIPCLQDVGAQVPLYTYPDQYCRAQGFPNNTFTIDRHTGQIVWATPCQVGIFNIAILIREYRAGLLLGTLIRDMQIIVDNQPNDPPQIVALHDTCIRAGEKLVIRVKATDKQTLQAVTLSADGAPFYVSSSPATFPTVVGNAITGTFTWQTDCSHIQKQNYLTVFRAIDNYVEPPLVDLETWQIHVIAPPPLGLTAVASNQKVVLNWNNPYTCASSADFRGFSVWRKVGCDPFTPDYCETGLANHGYTKLTGANIFTYTYTDFTTVVGQQYSYRIVAHFSKISPNGIFQYDQNESVASDEVCVFMPISVPVILNVDVQQTDVANGQIFVRWMKPFAGGNNLDTLQNPPPYRFDLYRGTGFNFSNAVLIHTSGNANSFSALIDTEYLDTNINTKDSAWSYKVLFYSNNDTVGASAMASSIYLSIQPSDQTLILNWQENVPWTNDSFAVYKLNKITSLFETIDTVFAHQYADTGLINDSVYCYYVQAYGHYTVGAFPKPLINKSEEQCAVPIDTTPPCPPVLSVRNDCDQYAGAPWTASQFINYLSWSIQQNSCSDDINHYYIYFGNDSANMALIDSLTSKDDTTFNHILPESLAGCYAVTAVDRIGNESRYSNVFCIDNCPYYVLPNTFTPNGDGQNDFFHPFKPYRFVPKIEMKIYNRWGEEVFSTEDPEIHWDGKDQKGKEVSEGVYVYGGYYYEQHQSGLVKKPLSAQKKGGGFIHLIRGK